MVDIFVKKDSLSSGEQTDKRYPVYVITCDDNLQVMDGQIDIKPLRFRSAKGAVDWSKEYALKSGWNAWTVTGPGGRIWYQRNKKTGYERSLL